MGGAASVSSSPPATVGTVADTTYNNDDYALSQVLKLQTLFLNELNTDNGHIKPFCSEPFSAQQSLLRQEDFLRLVYDVVSARQNAVKEQLQSAACYSSHGSSSSFSGSNSSASAAAVNNMKCERMVNFMLNESRGKEEEVGENVQSSHHHHQQQQQWQQENGRLQISWCDLEVTVPMTSSSLCGKDGNSMDFIQTSREYILRTREAAVATAVEDIEDDEEEEEEGRVVVCVLNQLTLVQDNDNNNNSPVAAAGARIEQIMGQMLPRLLGLGLPKQRGSRGDAATATTDANADAVDVLQVHSIVLSNNGLRNGTGGYTDDDIDGFYQAPYMCFMLNLAANPLQSWSLWDTVRFCPVTLLVLDLSYCVGGNQLEQQQTPLGLVLYAGCFLGCPQLTRLVLDGCGLTSTLAYLPVPMPPISVQTTTAATPGVRTGGGGIVVAACTASDKQSTADVVDNNAPKPTAAASGKSGNTSNNSRVKASAGKVKRGKSTASDAATATTVTVAVDGTVRTGGTKTTKTKAAKSTALSTALAENVVTTTTTTAITISAVAVKSEPPTMSPPAAFASGNEPVASVAPPLSLPPTLPLSHVSVFCGLISLTDLSLADNLFHTSDALLAGLLQQPQKSGESVAGAGASASLLLPLTSLRHMTIADNPCCEEVTAAEYTALQQTLFERCPALEEVDGCPRAGKYAAATSSLLHRHHHNSAMTDTSSDLHLLNEKEYLSALKGERDCTVVA